MVYKYREIIFCAQVYYKEAVGAFVVFDVTRMSTFEAVQMWKTDLDNKVLLPNGKPIPAVLLANKVRMKTRLHNHIVQECSYSIFVIDRGFLFPVRSIQ